MTLSPFPKGFLWGAATASYQVEGGIDTCDWAAAAREGRVPLCGRACDHYHRFTEDFDLARSLGHTAHRFSLEWARIEPEDGVFDETEIEHYRSVLTALRDRKLEPIVTVWHWTLPLWLTQRGGIECPEFPRIFARYAARVTDRLGDLAHYFSTINEPYSTIINGWVRGTFPPFHRFPLVNRVRAAHDTASAAHPTTDWRGGFKFFSLANTLADAHNRAYRAIKTVRPTIDVSITFQVHVFDGISFKDRMLARFMTWNTTHRFLKRVAPSCDTIGLNYYFYTTFGDQRQYQKTDMGWDSRPEGIRAALHTVKRYGKPVMVHECGCADEHDRFRAHYIRDTVRAVGEAIADGVDVRGFCYWSLLDNYEWTHGFDKRFGLVAVDYDTLMRTPRPSAHVYKAICDSNGTVD